VRAALGHGLAEAVRGRQAAVLGAAARSRD
jgi:hypothetical protein